MGHAQRTHLHHHPRHLPHLNGPSLAALPATPALTHWPPHAGQPLNDQGSVAARETPEDAQMTRDMAASSGFWSGKARPVGSAPSAPPASAMQGGAPARSDWVDRV